MKQVNYEEISKVYDDVREGDVMLVNQFLKELASLESVNVLDIGCGTGNYTDLFQKITPDRGYSFHGIDPSEGMLSRAVRRTVSSHIKQARPNRFLRKPTALILCI